MSIQPLYWTLAVEVQFYLMLIFVAPILTGKNGVKWLISLIGANIIYRLSPLSSEGLVFGNILPGRISEFCYGMIIAKIFLEYPSIIDRLKRPMPVITFIMLSIVIIAFCWGLWLKTGDSILNSRAGNMLYYPFLGMGYGFLFLLILISPQFNKIMSLKPVVFIGTISYSIYLWHVFILKSLAGVASGIAGFYLNLFATIILSTLSYYLIERTFLKLKA